MESTMKSLALKYGMYLGITMILIMTLMYVIDLEIMTKWWLNIILFLIIITFGIVSVSKIKKLVGGFMTFKQAFSSYFITVAIGVIISTVFSIILFNVIDPEAAEFLKEKIIETSTRMMENFGAPQADIDKAIDGMREQEQFSVISQLKSIAWQLLVYAIIGLIVALAMRKSEPISMN